MEATKMGHFKTPLLPQMCKTVEGKNKIFKQKTLGTSGNSWLFKTHGLEMSICFCNDSAPKQPLLGFHFWPCNAMWFWVS